MEDYKNLSDTELAELLKKTEDKLEDAKDELDIVGERSNSGQHVDSVTLRSNKKRIEQEIELLNSSIENIKAEIKGRKK
jgi:hypothetical protein